MELSVCVTDDDFAAWRAVWIAVVPGERCDTVAELRAQDSPDRLMLLARVDGNVAGSGIASPAEAADTGFAAPRVLHEYRRLGVGTALLRASAAHCTSRGLFTLRAHVEDEGSLAFAERFGFAEVDHQVEQVRAVGVEEPPSAPPAGVEVILASQRPELWASCFEGFGKEVLADFAVYTPMQVSPEEWSTSWRGDPMFLALHNGEVIGCAGLHPDTDRPERAENALSAVRREWRGRGVASHLKRRTLHWAALNGVETVYTWTQAGNTPMLRLNEHLGYVRTRTSTTVSRTLPLQ